MTASAVTSINGDASRIAHIVAYSATVNLALASMVDVRTVTFSFVSDSLGSASFPAITYGTFGSASFAMPADPSTGAGWGFLIQAVVNESTPTQSIWRFIVGVPSTAGVIPIPAGETTERNAILGWLEALNEVIAAAGGGVGTLGEGKVIIGGPSGNQIRVLVAADITGAVATTDARLSNARTPTAHAATHVTGGGDTIANAVSGGNAGLMTGTDKAAHDLMKAQLTGDTTTSRLEGSVSATLTINASDILEVTDTAVTALFSVPYKIGTIDGPIQVAGVDTGEMQLGDASAPVLVQGTNARLAASGTASIDIDGSARLTLDGVTVAAADPISTGTNPATTGAVRVPNNSGLVSRNATNGGNVNLIKADGSNTIWLGDASIPATPTSGQVGYLFYVSAAGAYAIAPSADLGLPVFGAWSSRVSVSSGTDYVIATIAMADATRASQVWQIEIEAEMAVRLQSDASVQGRLFGHQLLAVTYDGAGSATVKTTSPSTDETILELNNSQGIPVITALFWSQSSGVVSAHLMKNAGGNDTYAKCRFRKVTEYRVDNW